MNYIVLDMEWNQPFTFEGMIQEPVMLHGEVIQIGAVKLDENYWMLDTFKIIVTPQYYKRMHKKVSRITGITTEELQYGFPFPIAFRHFQKWCGEEFVFLTWGADDITMLRNNMMLYELDMAWIPKSYNIQIIFDSQITKENRQVSLTDAIEKIGKPALEAHDALNDARNTAVVCQCLDMAKGMEEYDTMNKFASARRWEDEPLDCWRPQHIYSSRSDAIHDSKLVQFSCPFCGGEMVCVDFVWQKRGTYICIGKCENGEEVFVRFNFAKLSDDSYRAARILYEMNERNKAYYLHKKQKAADKKAAYLQRIADSQKEKTVECDVDKQSERECVI